MLITNISEGYPETKFGVCWLKVFIGRDPSVAKIDEELMIQSLKLFVFLGKELGYNPKVDC